MGSLPPDRSEPSDLAFKTDADNRPSTAPQKWLPPELSAGRSATVLTKIAGTVEQIHSPASIRVGGKVVNVDRNRFAVAGLVEHARLGDVVTLGPPDRPARGEIISLESDRAIVKPFEPVAQTRLGDIAWLSGPLEIRPGVSWKGRTLNALAEPIDGRGILETGRTPYAAASSLRSPLQVDRITQPLRTGVRAIDIFTPLSAGQRIGIFAGSGVGKSSLLSMLCKGNDFDTVVFALVGERSREVRHFIDDVFAHINDRTIAVVASGAESAMMRRLAPGTAMSIAEHLRDEGEKVLLVIDSLTRFAHASREVGLAAGEPAVARGYPPSVFSDLPHLIERAGPGVGGKGSITGIFSVLVDSDDQQDPVADGLRGILDGHIVLSREIAEQGRYPAIDILASISRLSDISWSTKQRELVTSLKTLAAKYESTRDLRSVGAYKEGSDAELDKAISIIPRLYRILSQHPSDPPSRDAFADLAQMLTGAD